MKEGGTSDMEGGFSASRAREEVDSPRGITALVALTFVYSKTNSNNIPHIKVVSVLQM